VESDIGHPTTASHAIPVETQVLAALQFFGTGSYYAVGHSTVIGRTYVVIVPVIMSLAIDGVTRALVELAPNYITFPDDQQTLRRTKLAFHCATCIGALSFPVENESVPKIIISYRINLFLKLQSLFW